MTDRLTQQILDVQHGERVHHHWHYVYRRRRKNSLNISSRQIVVGQVIALSGSMVAGYLLELNKNHFALFAGSLLLLPGIIDLSASITGAMCAKINHRLDSDSRVSRVLASSIGFSFALSIFSGAIVGITGGLIGELFFGSTFWKILVLCQLAMISVGIIVYPLMAFITIAVKRLGYDPDNIVGPVETGLSDALMVMIVSVLVRTLA